MAKSSRKGRYRKRLVSQEFVASYAKQWALLFAELRSLKAINKLSSAEYLGYCFLAMLICRQKNFYESHPQELDGKSQSEFTLIHFKHLLVKYNLPVHQILNTSDSLEAFLVSKRLRGIPSASRLALISWLQGLYPLQLYDDMPSVEEVFSLQKKGQRCITLFCEEKQICQIIDGRDIISFVCHDLMHAYEFYHDERMMRCQIGFYQWLGVIKNDEHLLDLLRISDDFRNYWDYLRSDMNSYCGHLLKTLQASIVIHSKNDGMRCWINLIDRNFATDIEANLLKKINTSEWNKLDFIFLEEYLLNYYQASENKMNALRETIN